MMLDVRVVNSRLDHLFFFLFIILFIILFFIFFYFLYLDLNSKVEYDTIYITKHGEGMICVIVTCDIEKIIEGSRIDNIIQYNNNILAL